MKNKKVLREFFFSDKNYKEVVDIINNEFPISLIHNIDLIDRVYARYPIIDKAQIAIIVKVIFETMRELLLSGAVLNFNNLFFDAKLHFFTHLRNGNILPALKMKISTPPPMR